MHDTDTTCAGDYIGAGEYSIDFRGIIYAHLKQLGEYCKYNVCKVNITREILSIQLILQGEDCEYNQGTNAYKVSIAKEVLCTLLI